MATKPAFQSSCVASAMATLFSLTWLGNDLLQFGVVALAAGVFAARHAEGQDPAMGGMIGGTLGGLAGGIIWALFQHLFVVPVHDSAMMIMMYSMAGMIGGTVGGGLAAAP